MGWAQQCPAELCMWRGLGKENCLVSHIQHPNIMHLAWFSCWALQIQEWEHKWGKHQAGEVMGNTWLKFSEGELWNKKGLCCCSSWFSQESGLEEDSFQYLVIKMTDFFHGNSCSWLSHSQFILLIHQFQVSTGFSIIAAWNRFLEDW